MSNPHMSKPPEISAETVTELVHSEYKIILKCHDWLDVVMVMESENWVDFEKGMDMALWVSCNRDT